jgi:predicted AAA+ superfamily ATPase
MAIIPQLQNWSDVVEDLATYYREHGTGLFAQYRAFRWQNGALVGITYPDSVKLSTLVGYEWQKDALVKNTEFLLSGETALHVLLYGSRGSGKSSLVKALLNEYSHRNLRLIEVSKLELPDLPKIIEQLRGVPQKFIIFVDDLSFEEDDDAFKAMKVVLEGNVTARPENVVVYATSNRRHLIREYFTDRPAPKDHNEVHGWDTMQEKLSFSDRFGLTLTFEAADQKTYLQIVQHLAANINIDPEDLEFQALQWATRHNGRSGRTARQFIDFLKADLALFGEIQNPTPES